MNKDISQKNSSFWNELCGTQIAKHLGVRDDSVESLKKFDEWYFDFYPYLDTYIPFAGLEGKDVLEVGLGYGSVAQRLVENGCNYHGLDIASGPVSMVKHRINQIGLRGTVLHGSILSPPFSERSFDAIVAIGCLHHTGDLRLALKKCHELLRPGGKLIFMVYYAYSYRRWYSNFSITLQYLYKELFGFRGVVPYSSDADRAAYDRSSDGDGAPHTDWISKKSLMAYCSEFERISCRTENIAQEPPFIMCSRGCLMRTFLPRVVGLDLYAVAIK